MRRALKGTIAIAAIVGMLGVAPAAMANTRDVIKQGACSGTSNWKLTLSPEHGNIQVEFEVDSNIVGQTWNVRLTQNGTKIAGGSRVTQAPDGSFTVRKLTPNLAGIDVIKGRAVNAATGETCVGRGQYAA